MSAQDAHEAIEPVELPEEPIHPPHVVSYPRFLWKSLGVATDGNLLFYAWMTFLTALMLVGVNTWAHQIVDGMGLTAMSDHVSWGLYIANFTFVVGLAAGAVMMVIPAYLYRDKAMHDVVIVGEILAIAAIVMAIAFVTVDVGRPDRLWHMMPGLGRFNWPMSMLTWDVIVLNGYLFLNLHVVGYLLYMRFLGRKPDKRWYIPFVLLSIVWTISIHTVTAFLYSGLGARPFWNNPLLAPRFLASAFVSGPAFIIIALQIAQRFAGLHLPDGPIRLLLKVLRVTVLLNLFMLGSELFTELYAGGSHAQAVQYLFFGLYGYSALVPWIWTAVILNITSAILLLALDENRRMGWVSFACGMAIVGVWIEKGMGLIIPGFVPSVLHEFVEYTPNVVEWKITIGVWALGLMIFTLGTKLAIAVFKGEMNVHEKTGGP